MKLINRPLYTNRIRPFIGKGIIKVLTGQRRVGKSCILKQLQIDILKENPQANILYINMEYEEFRGIRNDSNICAISFRKVWITISLLMKCRILMALNMCCAACRQEIAAIFILLVATLKCFQESCLLIFQEDMWNFMYTV